MYRLRYTFKEVPEVSGVEVGMHLLLTELQVVSLSILTITKQERFEIILTLVLNIT